MDSDYILIKKMKMGNETAIDTFVRKYYPAIFRYCLFHINDRGYAQDLTQETFVKFFTNFDKYVHSGKALNYLYVIAGNACKDYYRKKSRAVTEVSMEGVYAAEKFNGAKSDCEKPDYAKLDYAKPERIISSGCKGYNRNAYEIEGIIERLDIHSAFDSLPEEIKETAVLYFMQELSQKDIARILGIGLPLVKYRIKRARELLALYIGNDND